MKKAFLLIIAVLLLFNCEAAYATGTIYYNYYETRYTYILGETVNEEGSFSGNANSEGFLSTPGVETYPSSVLSDFTWTYNETSNSKHYYSVYDKTGTIYRRTGTIQIEAVAAEIGTTSIKFGAGGSFHVQYWDCQVNSPVFTITVISNNYSVNLHANGGYCEKTSHSVVYDYPYSKEENLPVPTREGYIFLGWYTAPSDGIQITDTTVFNNRADVINKRPITLYAHWEPVSYTVTYSGSAAGVTNVPAGQTKLHGQALQLSDQVPEREGHHFLGWGTNPDNNVVSYQPGDTFSLDEDSTLYAVWERFFTIIYDANGGTGAPTAQTKLQGETLMLSSSEPSRSDTVSSYTISLDPNGGLVNTDSLTAARTTSYRFTEWNTVSDGSRTAYAPSASYTADADAVLYAQWVSSSVTESVMLPTPTREGYTFKGWAEDRDADGGIIGNYTPTGDATLYALWEEDTTPYEMILPAFLTTIGEEAFACGTFKYVTLPESVTSIGSKAFANCQNLKKIVFVNGNIDVAEDFVSGCPFDLVIEAPEGSVVANSLELYFRYICPMPEDPRRPEDSTPRF